MNLPSDTQELTPEPTATPVAVPASRATARRWIVWALLVIAGATAGFVGYQVVQLQAEITAVQTQQSTVQHTVDTALAKQQAALDALTKTQQQQRQILNDIVSVDRINWMLAEAEYLVRIANQRLLVSRDIRGATELLESADSLLAGANDGSLLAVRQVLASDLADLKQMTPSDGEGLYVRLDALIGKVAQLPVTADKDHSATDAAAATAPEAATGFARVQQLLARLGIYLERSDVPVHMPVTRKEGELVRQNLRLMLEQAQLALMQRDAQVYRLCLRHASEWIKQYFSQDDAAVHLLLDELTALSAVQLATSLPDITQSLNALHDEIRKHYEHVPGAVMPGNAAPAAGSEAVTP